MARLLKRTQKTYAGKPSTAVFEGVDSYLISRSLKTRNLWIDDTREEGGEILSRLGIFHLFSETSGEKGRPLSPLVCRSSTLTRASALPANH